MGSDPERSVVDADGQSWDVKRLYVGDGSRRAAHALRQPVADDHGAGDAALAGHLDDDPHGYLS